jgi:hypothetical protein
MAITTRTAWQRDGAPWRLAKPISDFAATLRRHGYLIGTLGDDRHLNAVPPEDHTPYSQTGWPGTSPYPVVMAIDIERAPSGVPNTVALGARIVKDKLANHVGTRWIKYINWTDADGNCWNDSWTPNHVRSRSTDRGHVHISCRTDYATSAVAATYDPLADLLGEETMTPQEFLAILKNSAVAAELARLPHTYRGSNAPIDATHPDEWQILHDIAKNTATPPAPAIGTVTLDDVRTVIREELAKLNLSLEM